MFETVIKTRLKSLGKENIMEKVKKMQTDFMRSLQEREREGERDVAEFKKRHNRTVRINKGTVHKLAIQPNATMVELDMKLLQNPWCTNIIF